MDLLKKALLITFYTMIILIGIAGFLVLRSLRGEEKLLQPDPVQHERSIVKTQEALEHSNATGELNNE